MLIDGEYSLIAIWTHTSSSEVSLFVNRLSSPPFLGATSVTTSEWNFVQNGMSEILALEIAIVSPTPALFFDRVSNDPCQHEMLHEYGNDYCHSNKCRFQYILHLEVLE